MHISPITCNSLSSRINTDYYAPLAHTTHTITSNLSGKNFSNCMQVHTQSQPGSPSFSNRVTPQYQHSSFQGALMGEPYSEPPFEAQPPLQGHSTFSAGSHDQPQGWGDKTQGSHASMTSQQYPYTRDLMKLDSHRPPKIVPLPTNCTVTTTPLKVNEWEAALGAHPDRLFVQYILHGISEGFRIGYNYSQASCSSARGNMKSAGDNPAVVDEYLEKEIASHRVIEIPTSLADLIQVSRFGVIPKQNQPNKFRLILDLSSPEGTSVNDGIDPLLCSMKYSSVDMAVEKILELGKGAQLAKVDIESAYRNVPVHREDRHMLGMHWKGRLHIDTVLPFGLRSAPKIFSSVADALEWILLHKGVSTVIHYLDDFLTMGTADSGQCSRNLERIIAVCQRLGVPLKAEKIEGPAEVITFLGITLDTMKQEIRLPPQKITQLKQLLSSWRHRKRGKKRELLSLIGKLSHACKVVVAGRLFLRRMIDLSTRVPRLNYWISLDDGFRSDVVWWITFLELWNGCSFMDVHQGTREPSVTFYTDASGAWGCGAV